MFKRYIAIYFLVGVTGGVLIIIASMFGGNSSIAFGIVLMVLFVMATWLVVNGLATKKYNEIIAILNQQCNPQLFMQEVSTMHNTKRTRNIICVNQSAAYTNMGMFAQAQQVLAETVPFKGDYRDILALTAYYNNYTVAFVEAGNMAMAEDMLGRLRALLDAPAAKAKYDTIYNIYSNLCVTLRVAKGNYDGAEIQYFQEIDCAQSLMRKVFAHWQLAKIYIAQNRIPEAKAALQFVADNGGSTYYQAAAANQLASMPQ